MGVGGIVALIGPDLLLFHFAGLFPSVSISLTALVQGRDPSHRFRVDDDGRRVTFLPPAGTPEGDSPDPSDSAADPSADAAPPLGSSPQGRSPKPAKRPRSDEPPAAAPADKRGEGINGAGPGSDIPPATASGLLRGAAPAVATGGRGVYSKGDRLAGTAWGTEMNEGAGTGVRSPSAPNILSRLGPPAGSGGHPGDAGIQRNRGDPAWLLRGNEEPFRVSWHPEDMGLAAAGAAAERGPDDLDEIRSLDREAQNHAPRV